MSIPRWVGPAVLLLSVAGGTWLRLWPSLPAGRTEFLSDGATIARLALESAATGRLPAVDSLAEAPAGRALGPVLAPGLIVGAGAFHRLRASLGSRSPQLDLEWFGAIAGGLIAVPVYLWARVQWGAGLAAPFAALAIVFLPAHIHRTFGYMMRYEALGSLLVAGHLACVAAAIAASSARRRLLLAALGAALLVASLWAWRVPLILPLLEAALLAAWIAARGAGRGERDVLAIQLAGATLATLALEYLRAQRMAVTATWLAAVAVAAIAFVPRLAPGRAKGLERAAWLGGAIALALLAGRFTGGAESYGSMGSFIATKVRLLLGQPVDPDPFTRLMLVIEELGSLSPAALFFGAINFAFLGPWLLGAPVILWLAAGRPGASRLRELPAHAWFLAGITVALLLLSMFVHRAKVLAAPAAVVVAAGVLPALLAPFARAGAAPAPAQTPAARPRRGSPHRGARAGTPDAPGLRAVLVALLALCVAANAWMSVAVAATRSSRLPDGERAALEYLARETAPEAIVATLFEHGFETQSYARRRTLIDGFLESAVGRRRMLELARLGFERSPAPLAAWCRSLGADYLLVPPSTHLNGLATLALPELVPILRTSARLNRDQADRTIIRMMVFGSEEPPFRKVFDHERWRIYSLAAADSARAIAGPPALERPGLMPPSEP